jgi:hypothetical protein
MLNGKKIRKSPYIGKIVMEFPLIKNNQLIDADPLKIGVYFVKIEDQISKIVVE